MDETDTNIEGLVRRYYVNLETLLFAHMWLLNRYFIFDLKCLDLRKYSFDSLKNHSCVNLN